MGHILFARERGVRLSGSQNTDLSVEASAWPNKGADIDVQQVPSEDHLARFAVSGKWPDHPSAKLTMIFSDRRQRVAYDPVGAVGLIQGQVSEPDQLKQFIVGVTNGKKGSRQNVKPNANGFFKVTIPVSSTDLLAREDNFAPKFEIILVRGEADPRPFEIAIDDARIVTHYDPRLFIDQYVEDAGASDDSRKFEHAALARYNEWVEREGSKLHLEGAQQLTNPFIIHKVGRALDFNMFCATMNSHRWYGRTQAHNLDFFAEDGLVERGGVVLDCGAHAGLYTTFFAKVVGEQGRVFAFDPFPQNNIQVEVNAILNNVKNVHVEWAGVGAQRSTKSVSNKGQKLSEAVQDHDMIEIRAVPLDDYVQYKPTFIKLDVEGFEVEALKGAQRVLNDCLPKCYIEIHPQFLPLFGADSRDLFNLIPLHRYNALLSTKEINNGAPTKLNPDFVMKEMGRLILIPA